MKNLELTLHNVTQLVELHKSHPSLRHKVSVKQIDSYVALSMVSQQFLQDNISVHNSQQYGMIMEKLCELMTILGLDNLKVLMLKQTLMVQKTFLKMHGSN